MKKLVELSAQVAKRKAVECVFCHGTGILDNGVSSCSICARLREIAEWCWHGYQDLVDVYNGNASMGLHGFVKGEIWGSIRLCECCGYAEWDYYMINGIHESTWLPACSCKPVNPTFTIPALRALLEDLGGEWKPFKWWLRTHWNLIEFAIPEIELCELTIEDILTDPALFAQATESYLTTIVEVKG